MYTVYTYTYRARCVLYCIYICTILYPTLYSIHVIYYILSTIYTLYLCVQHTTIPYAYTIYLRLIVIRTSFSLYIALQGRAAQTLCQVLSGCPKLIIQLQHTSILADLLSGGTAGTGASGGTAGTGASGGTAAGTGASGGTAAGTGASGGTVKYSTPVVVKMLTSLNKMLEDEEVRLYYSIEYIYCIVCIVLYV